MKRGVELAGFLGHGAEIAAKRRAALDSASDGPVPANSQRMGLKMLFPQQEASIIEGQDGATLKSLEGMTGTRVRLSPEGSCYPGTMLRQLTILGSGCDDVLSAAIHAISYVAEELGAVAGDEANVEPEGARLKVLVPQEVAAALDKEGLQLGDGVSLRVLPAAAAPLGQASELAEQVVCLSGNLIAVRGALQMLAERVAALASRSWFGRWASHSQCRGGATRSGGGALATSAGRGGGVSIPGELSVPWGEGMDVQGDQQQGASTRGEFTSRWDEGMPSEVGLPQGTLALKLLLLPEEVAVLRGEHGEHGATANEIQQKTDTEFRFHPLGETYPGTSLEELCLLAPSCASAMQGVAEALNSVLAARGSLGGGNSGEQPPEQGSGHVKLVIPSKATSAVIGPGGKVVAQIRAETQMHVHVESTAVPLNGSLDLSEQVVSFDGPLSGVEPALTMVANILAQLVNEPWFSQWGARSNSGSVIPGLALFMDDVKGGKGKSKGKGKGKDSHAVAGSPGSGCYVMKLLLPPNEASCVLGRGGTTVREIGQATGAKITLSNRDQFYPGTQLQESIIRGSNQESVLNAVLQLVERIASLSGSVSGGEMGVEPGGCRLKVVVPSRSASAIIGPGGAFIKAMRERSRMHIHVEETMIPPGPPSEVTEQVVSLSGPLDGASAALSSLAEAIGQYSVEAWFDAWASSTNCGLVVPGLVLFTKGKGKGKTKGHEEHLGLYVPGKDKGGGKFKGAGKAPTKGPSDGFGRPPPVGARFDGGGAANGLPAMPPGSVALKVLLSAEECDILSQDADAMAHIKRSTGTAGMLSDTTFPGTPLQELAIQGPSADSLLEALVMIFQKIAAVVGSVRSGELAVPRGDARVKLVVPQRIAAAIIGPGGQNVKQLKAQHGLHVHIDPTAIPCPQGMSEQGVCIAGPLASTEVALSQILSALANSCGEPWFEAWASHSNAGKVMPGLVLFEGKGKGGGKGPPPPGGQDFKGGKGAGAAKGWDGGKGGKAGWGGKGPAAHGGCEGRSGPPVFSGFGGARGPPVFGSRGGY